MVMGFPASSIPPFLRNSGYLIVERLVARRTQGNENEGHGLANHRRMLCRFSASRSLTSTDFLFRTRQRCRAAECRRPGLFSEAYAQLQYVPAATTAVLVHIIGEAMTCTTYNCNNTMQSPAGLSYIGFSASWSLDSVSRFRAVCE